MVKFDPGRIRDLDSDEHLTKLGSYAGIPIVSPRRFLEILDEQQQ